MNTPTQLIERIASIEKKPSALVPQATTPADLLRMAVAGGADLDKLERLTAVQWRKLDQLGGAALIRERIDRAKTK